MENKFSYFVATAKVGQLVLLLLLVPSAAFAWQADYSILQTPVVSLPDSELALSVVLTVTFEADDPDTFILREFTAGVQITDAVGGNTDVVDIPSRTHPDVPLTYLGVDEANSVSPLTEFFLNTRNEGNYVYNRQSSTNVITADDYACSRGSEPVAYNGTIAGDICTFSIITLRIDVKSSAPFPSAYRISATGFLDDGTLQPGLSPSIFAFTGDGFSRSPSVLLNSRGFIIIDRLVMAVASFSSGTVYSGLTATIRGVGLELRSALNNKLVPVDITVVFTSSCTGCSSEPPPMAVYRGQPFSAGVLTGDLEVTASLADNRSTATLVISANIPGDVSIDLPAVTLVDSGGLHWQVNSPLTGSRIFSGISTTLSGLSLELVTQTGMRVNSFAGAVQFDLNCAGCSMISTMNYSFSQTHFAGGLLTGDLVVDISLANPGTTAQLSVFARSPAVLSLSSTPVLTNSAIAVAELVPRLEPVAQSAVTVLSGQETVLTAVSLARVLDQTTNIPAAGFFGTVDPAEVTARLNCALCTPPDPPVTIDYDRTRTDEVLSATLTFTATLAEGRAVGELTIFAEVAGQEAAVLENVTIFRAVPSELLNVDGLESLTAQDLVLSLRWLSQIRPDTGENLVANLPISTDTVTAAALVNLQSLLDELQSFSDINEDGVSDALDLRILLRYLSGLRGDSLLGSNVNLSRLRQQLGL